VKPSGFGIFGVGCRVARTRGGCSRTWVARRSGLGFRVQGRVVRIFGFRVQGRVVRILGFRFRVQQDCGNRGLLEVEEGGDGDGSAGHSGLGLRVRSF